MATKTKRSSRKRYNVQTTDPEIQKKVLAYRDSLLSGNDPIQEAHDIKRREESRLNNQKSVPPKPVSISQKQNQIAEVTVILKNQIATINKAVHKHFKGIEPEKSATLIKETRGIQEWLDVTQGGLESCMALNHDTISILKENL